MNRSMLTRFLADLPEISTIGNLSPEQSEKIRVHYNAQLNNSSSPFPTILSILGTLLIGLGIILLFAHNWSGFDELQKSAIALIPFIAAILFGGVGISRQWESTQFRESSATLIFLSFASSVGLINQAWQTGGSLESFLTLLSFAGLPLIYLFRSYTVAVIYSIILIWLPWITRDLFWWQQDYSLMYWVLAPLLTPFLVMQFRKNATEPPFLLLLWVVAISMLSASLSALPFEPFDEQGVVVLLTVAVGILTADSLFFKNDKSGWTAPFRTSAKITLILFYIFLSHSGLFIEFIDDSGRGEFPLALLALTLFAGAITLLVLKNEKEPLPFLLPAGVIILGYSAGNMHEGIAIIFPFLMNISLLAVGIITMKSGADELMLRRVNFGFLMIAAVILLRFFDSDLPFTLRGIMFILLGIGFLVTNLKISARRKKHV